jgi:hypothetical protein
VSVVLTLIAVLLGLLALLAVPLELAFRVRGIEAFNGRVAIRWLFGMVRFSLGIPDAVRFGPRQARRKPQPAPPRAKRRRGGGRGRVLAVIRQEQFRRRLHRLLRDLVRATRLRQLGLRMRLGLGDPADTGRPWALVGPLNAATQSLRTAKVQIEPEFIDPVLEFEAEGSLRLVPLQLLALLVAFALSPSSLRAWRTLATSHA